MVVTGYTGTEIRQILEHMSESQSARDRVSTGALMKMGGDAPAFGMLGTLIGLVIMLSNMSGDPASIGPSMAVALITTFYGVCLARLVVEVKDQFLIDRDMNRESGSAQA